MSEVITDKQSKPGPFAGEVFTCIDCGEGVERRGIVHKRCRKCAAEATQDIKQKKNNRLFPVLNKSLLWLPGYLLGDRVFAESKKHAEEQRKELRKELGRPSPCSTCSLMSKCANELLMCRQYYNYTLSTLKNFSFAPGRRDPQRWFYQKSFPNDKETKRTLSKANEVKAG